MRLLLRAVPCSADGQQSVGGDGVRLGPACWSGKAPSLAASTRTGTFHRLAYSGPYHFPEPRSNSMTSLSANPRLSSRRVAAYRPGR